MSPRRARATLGRVGEDPATALREHLIETAVRLFDTRPVSQITTRLLASSAGVSDGVLYNHFTDKQDLLVAALLRRYEEVLVDYDADLPRPGTSTVEANLVVYAEAALGLITRTMPTVVGLMSEPALMHRFVAALHRDPFGAQRLRGPLVSYLTAEQELGRLGRAPVADVVSLVLGPVVLLGVTALVEHSQDEPAARIPELIRTLMAGIGPNGT